MASRRIGCNGKCQQFCFSLSRCTRCFSDIRHEICMLMPTEQRNQQARLTVGPAVTLGNASCSRVQQGGLKQNLCCKVLIWSLLPAGEWPAFLDKTYFKRASAFKCFAHHGCVKNSWGWGGVYLHRHNHRYHHLNEN